jgi:hypothetical protein
MKRFHLMHKGIPNAEDGTELAMNGVKIVTTLFAGALLIVEGPDNLASMLSDRWVVDEDREVSAI